MKRFMFIWILGIFLITTVTGNGLIFAANDHLIKNVILMITDGNGL